MIQFDLSRFEQAHRRDYQTALSEIKSGRKLSHWMWYIFPQMSGLGRSYTSVYYAISNLEEAKQFLADLYLGANLIEISNALLNLETDSAVDVFGNVDASKLRSSMTLFSLADENQTVFKAVLDKFFNGKPCFRTIKKFGK